MFTDHPDYHKMFYRFKNIPVAELNKCEYLRTKQGPNVAASVVKLVEGMEDANAIDEWVKWIVEKKVHTKHNLTANDYLNVLKNLVKTMKKCLGDEMTSDDEAAWVKLAMHLVPIFEQKLQQ